MEMMITEEKDFKTFYEIKIATKTRRWGERR